jgi:predicted DNA-binding transcriptional regulator AlpA
VGTIDGEVLISEAALAGKLRISRPTLSNMIAARAAPPYVPIGKRRMYRLAAVAAWLRASETAHT